MSTGDPDFFHQMVGIKGLVMLCFAILWRLSRPPRRSFSPEEGTIGAVFRMSCHQVSTYPSKVDRLNMEQKRLPWIYCPPLSSTTPKKLLKVCVVFFSPFWGQGGGAR